MRSAEAIKRFNKEYLPYPDGYTRRDGKKPTGKGFPIEDTWNCSSGDVLDSIMIKSFSTEKFGYPTQKTLALLERIIEASSNEGDIVLDPFCGGGTTLVAANNLNRQWIGIDISPRVVDLIRSRLYQAIPAFGIPTDMEGAILLKETNAYDFEAWAVSRVPGLAPNERQSGDRGMDGRGKIHEAIDGEEGLVLAQVKSGGYTAAALRDFQHVLERENATAGIFITLEKTAASNALAAAASAGKYRIGANVYPRLQFWSIREMFEGHVFPRLPTMKDPDRPNKVLEPRLL